MIIVYEVHASRIKAITIQYSIRKKYKSEERTSLVLQLFLLEILNKISLDIIERTPILSREIAIFSLIERKKRAGSAQEL